MKVKGITKAADCKVPPLKWNQALPSSAYCEVVLTKSDTLEPYIDGNSVKIPNWYIPSEISLCSDGLKIDDKCLPFKKPNANSKVSNGFKTGVQNVSNGSRNGSRNVNSNCIYGDTTIPRGASSLIIRGSDKKFVSCSKDGEMTVQDFSGGSAYKKTTQKTVVNGKTRCVYLKDRKKYVRMQGKFVRLTKDKKKK